MVVVANRRGAGEALALVVLDELVVGETLLVHRRALLVQLRLRVLAGRLLLGDACTLRGLLCPLLAQIGLLVVLVDDLVAALLQLALTLTKPLALAHLGQCDQQPDDEQRDDDDGDDDDADVHLNLLFRLPGAIPVFEGSRICPSV